jgi:hypothetical protein
MVSGWVLVGASVGLFLGALYFALWVPQVSVPALSAMVAVPGGVLLTLGGLLLTKSKESADSEEKRSLFYLDSCTKAYEEARSLLEDGNNDRATWIASARALKHARKLATEIRVDPHRRVLELQQLKYRRFFAELLRDKPAQFFYGTPDRSVPIDDAAAASSAREDRGGMIVTSTLKELSQASLKAVWEAAQWPNDYKDPLDGAEFSEEDQVHLMLFAPGLHAFLEHRRQYHSASGKLWPRRQN